jgi:hypothetical protein
LPVKLVNCFLDASDLQIHFPDENSGVVRGREVLSAAEGCLQFVDDMAGERQAKRQKTNDAGSQTGSESGGNQWDDANDLTGLECV